MTKDEILTLAGSKLLQYKIPVSIALITVMFALRACDADPEPSSDTPKESEIAAEPVPPPASRQTPAVNEVKPPPAQMSMSERVQDTLVARETEPPKPAPPPPPVKKEIPTWLPITEGMLPGRTMLALDSVEYIPIEGIPHHPERIYTNPDCIVELSRTPFSVGQVMEYINNEYISGEACIRDKAESNAMLDKTIPDTASYQEALPLDAVIIE